VGPKGLSRIYTLEKVELVDGGSALVEDDVVVALSSRCYGVADGSDGKPKLSVLLSKRGESIGGLFKQMLCGLQTFQQPTARRTHLLFYGVGVVGSQPACSEAGRL